MLDFLSKNSFSIKIIEGESETLINSPLITGIIQNPSSGISIIEGYLNYSKSSYYSQTSDLCDWALKINKFIDRSFSNLEISINTGDNPIEYIIENAAILNYEEISYYNSNFTRFEIVVQSRNVVNYYSYYKSKNISSTYKHIIFSPTFESEFCLENIEMFLNGEDFNEWDKKVEIFFKAFSEHQTEVEGNIIFDFSFNEYKKLFDTSKNIRKKIAEIIDESLLYTE